MYEYASLVRAVRVDGKVKHETLCRLGEVSQLRASGELDRIVAALERYLDRDQAAITLQAEDSRSAGVVAAVWAMWCRLGLDDWFGRIGTDRSAEHLADAVFAMVANRLVDPCSKRRVPEWAARDVVMPAGWNPPELQHYYRSLDTVAATKDDTESWLYSRLCDLANLDLQMVCYDLTSTYFEGSTRTGLDRFPAKAFGYSRDKRGDRPQIMIGLLCTSDGIPIAHHLFDGNTNDASTLPAVLADLASRFGVRPTVVADRGLISTANVAAVTEGGFGHILATKLHRDRYCTQALAKIDDTTTWVEVPDANSRATDVVLEDGTRAVVVESDARQVRDTARTEELVAKTESELLKLEHRVREGRLVDPAKIGAAAQRILSKHKVGRLFDIEIAKGRFVYHYNDDAFNYEHRLAGRYVLVTSLTPSQASAGRVVCAYRQLLGVEDRFRTLKDFLHLRPVRHWTTSRVAGHVAVCVYAAVIESLIGQALTHAAITDPDINTQTLSAQRALRELARIHQVTLNTGTKQVTLTTRRSPLQTAIATTLGIDTTTWTATTIT